MKIKIEERSQLYVYTDYEERNIYPLELNLMGVPELNIEGVYLKLEKFLNEKSEKRISRNYKPFGDWFEEGIISSPSLGESHHIGECLLENKIHGYGGIIGPRGTMHRIKIAGEPEKVDELSEQILSIIGKPCFLAGGFPNYDKTSVKIYEIPDNFNLKSFNSISELEKALSPEDKKIETNNKN